MTYFTTFKINNHIYQIKDAMGVLSTLVIGTNKALLIDTGYGIYNLKEHIQTITTLPLIVVDSHGHMDHTGGNFLFDHVYINKLDYELCKLHNSYAWRLNNLETAQKLGLIDDTYNKEAYLNKREGNLIFYSDDEIFDLGKIHVKVVNMEGHTKGSVGFLIIEDKILISSDAACPFVWIFLPESTDVSTYIKMLKRTLNLAFDNFLVGHGAGKLLPKKRMMEFLDVAESIDLSKSVRVRFNHFENANSYCYTKGTMYNQDDAGIVFDPNNLKSKD